MDEAGIRDLLASNLSVLEEELDCSKLNSSSRPVRLALAASSTSSPRANWVTGHWVIIEIKKTNAAARELYST
jgi:hypothetical protein